MRPAALVTGGAVRLGRHIATGLAQAGFDLAVHYNSSQTAAEQTRTALLAEGARCELYQADFLSGTDVEAELIRRVLTDFPNLSVLVNCASGYQSGSLKDTSAELLRTQLRVNLEAPVLLTKTFALAPGAALVINILDNKIHLAQHHYTAYLLSKKALAEFTVMAAIELAPKIRVNGVAPGVVLPMDSRSKSYLSWRVAGIPLHRQGKADHIFRAVSYLVENDFVTGQILTVDGGESANHVGRNADNYPGDST